MKEIQEQELSLEMQALQSVSGGAREWEQLVLLSAPRQPSAGFPLSLNPLLVSKEATVKDEQ